MMYCAGQYRLRYAFHVENSLSCTTGYLIPKRLMAARTLPVCRALRYLSLLHSSSATRLQSQREPGGPAKHRATFRFFVALLSWLVGTDQSRFGSLTMHRDFSSQPMLVKDVMTKKVTKAMFVGDYRRLCRKGGRPGPWGEGARSTLSGRP